MTEPNKSKLPDLKEVTGMATKLFSDVKRSITEIVQDYKVKRAESEAAQGPTTQTHEPAKPAKKPTPGQAAPTETKPSAKSAAEVSPDKQTGEDTSATQDKSDD
jgi:hypothetical protein